MASRQSWLDESDTPLIDQYAQKLSSFIEAMADGVIEKHEVEAQEERLVAVMKEIEPQLDDEMHAKVTRLLCELSAYNIMQFLNTIHEARPATKFRG